MPLTLPFLTGTLHASTFSLFPFLKGRAVITQAEQIMPVRQVCCDCISRAINVSASCHEKSLHPEVLSKAPLAALCLQAGDSCGFNSARLEAKRVPGKKQGLCMATRLAWGI